MRSVRMTGMILLSMLLVLCSVSLAGGEAYPEEPASPAWRVYDPSLHWMYAQLTSREKRAFSARYDAAAMGDVSLWDLSGLGLSAYEEERVMLALLQDCPELMMCSPEIPVLGFYAVLEDAQWFQNNAQGNRALLDACRERLNALKQSDAWGTTNLDHERAWDALMVKGTEYLLDDDGPEGSRHLTSDVRAACSVILNRTAVCEGFARSTQLALRFFGISCLYVSGDAGGGGHAWNYVCLDGAWHQYDPTWNRHDGETRYFHMTQADCAARRIREEFDAHGFQFPVCR